MPAPELKSTQPHMPSGPPTSAAANPTPLDMARGSDTSCNSAGLQLGGALLHTSPLPKCKAASAANNEERWMAAQWTDLNYSTIQQLRSHGNIPSTLRGKKDGKRDNRYQKFGSILLKTRGPIHEATALQG